METTPISLEERLLLVEWCAMLSGYDSVYYNKLSDQELVKEYQVLSGELKLRK